MRNVLVTSRIRRLAATTLLLLVPLAAAGGERELWLLWQKHLGSPDDPAGVVDACRAYAATLPQDPFLPVVQEIEAWHLLRANQSAEGVRLLTPYLKDGDDALARGAQRLARAWITRLQRERVVDALQDYYRHQVRYPPDLEALDAWSDHPPGAETLPMLDAWERPWRYRLVGFPGVPGYRDQKYVLESASIQPPGDPQAALALPYAKHIVARPLRVTLNSQGVPAVTLEFLGRNQQKETALSQVGESVDGLYIAHAGPGLVILCDTLHWKVLRWK